MPASCRRACHLTSQGDSVHVSARAVCAVRRVGEFCELFSESDSFPCKDGNEMERKPDFVAAEAPLGRSRSLCYLPQEAEESLPGVWSPGVALMSQQHTLRSS